MVVACKRYFLNSFGGGELRKTWRANIPRLSAQSAVAAFRFQFLLEVLVTLLAVCFVFLAFQLHFLVFSLTSLTAPQ